MAWSPQAGLPAAKSNGKRPFSSPTSTNSALFLRMFLIHAIAHNKTVRKTNAPNAQRAGREPTL